MLSSACTSVPEQLKGEYSSLTPKATSERDLQTLVRWAGVILETRPEDGHTCFEILSRQLEKSMRPELADQSMGRFVATCAVLVQRLERDPVQVPFQFTLEFP